jgi:hypothetical protein
MHAAGTPLPPLPAAGACTYQSLTPGRNQPIFVQRAQPQCGPENS